MPPYFYGTILSLAFITYGLILGWFFINILFQCRGLFLNRFRNQQAARDYIESGGDIELGEIRSDETTRRVHVLPDISEIPLPISGPKKLICCAVGDECVICLEGLEEREVCWVLVKCDHVFHKTCLEEWLKINPTCPLCRNLACSIIIIVQSNIFFFILFVSMTANNATYFLMPSFFFVIIC
ncbi:hypothetical protein DITRI_Ditri14bG0116100 [Diplodiscus trichospermus]